MIPSAMPATPIVFTLEEVNSLLPRLKSLMAAQMDRRNEIEGRLERLAGLLGTLPDTIEIEIAILRRSARSRASSSSAWRLINRHGAKSKPWAPC